MSRNEPKAPPTALWITTFGTPAFCSMPSSAASRLAVSETSQGTAKLSGSAFANSPSRSELRAIIATR